MNYAKPMQPEETVEQATARLKDLVKTRNQMGTAMWWNVVNDDCCMLASQILDKGGDREQLHQIIGKENAF